MRLTQAARSRRGFSLVETIVAVSLLLIGFMGITTMVLSSIQSNEYTRHLAMADNLSANLVEFWQSANYQKVEEFLDAGDGSASTYTTDSTPAFTDIQLNNAVTNWREQIADNLPGGRGVVSVNTNSDIGGIDAADIEIRVQWVQKGHVYSATKNLYRSSI